MEAGQKVGSFTFDPYLYDVPAILTTSIDYFEKHNAYHEEGIFRISPSAIKLQQLVQKWEAAEKTGVIPNIDDEEPHTVAVMLKQYFRDLPTPLLTVEFGDCFIIAGGVADDEAAIRSIKSAFGLLPLRNLKTIKTLMKMLQHTASLSEFNKMVPANLAIVFAPSLFRSTATEVEVILAESKEANKLAERFIKYADEFFESNEWNELMKQKEAEFQKMKLKKQGVPSFVVPKKAIPKPPAGSSGPPNLPPRGTKPRASTVIHPSPALRSSDPKGTMKPKLKVQKSPLTNSSPTTNSTPLGWGDAPVPPRPASEGVSFATALIQKFPRITFLYESLGLCITIGTREDNRLRIHSKFCIQSQTAMYDIFKPVWNGATVSFKHKSRNWFAEENGNISLRLIPPENPLPKPCIFSINTDDNDQIFIKSECYNTFIRVAPDNLLRLEKAPSPFQVCLKVALRADNKQFCAVNTDKNNLIIPNAPRLLDEKTMHFVQVEKLGGMCSIISIINNQKFYWSMNSSGELCASEKECGPNEIFTLHFPLPRFITIQSHKHTFASYELKNETIRFVNLPYNFELLPYLKKPPK